MGFDFGVSKTVLQNALGILSQAVGISDSQVFSNKDFDVALNNLIRTTPSLGSILVDNGTKFVARSRGSANLPLKVKSDGSDIEYAKLDVAGGGTGQTSLTSGAVLIGAGTSGITTKTNTAGAFLGDSDVQNISGAKTFANTTLALRNPANTFTGTLTNPVYTATTNWELEGPFSYIIYKTGTTIKLMNMVTRGIVSSGTTADVVIQAGIDALGNTSGKKIFIKAGLYTLTAALNFTAIDGYCQIQGEHNLGTQLRPSGDFAAFDINGKTAITLDNLYMTHNQVGYTSNLLRIRNATTSCNFNQLSFYDFGNLVGNAIGFDTTSGSIFRNNFNDCYTVGFANAVYGSVPNSSFFCNGNYFIGCWFWLPIRALSVNIASGGGFHNNNFMVCQIQGKTSAPNQTAVAFDYETNNSGNILYTTHEGCIAWDLGTGINYANVSTTAELTLVGCYEAWKIGGAGAASGNVRTFDVSTVNRGKSTQSGNASTKVFNIPHKLDTTPKSARVTAGSSDAAGNPVVTFDATNVIVTYPTAPPSGTNNLLFNWEAAVF